MYPSDCTYVHSHQSVDVYTMYPKQNYTKAEGQNLQTSIHGVCLLYPNESKFNMNMMYISNSIRKNQNIHN